MADAPMDKDAIRAAMEGAHCVRPRVILKRLRDGSSAFVLEARRGDRIESRQIEAQGGHRGQPTVADPDDVSAAIDELLPLE
jgi:hypothetical protein